jgi:transcriptional regulator with XRE-family HTH domain
MPRRRVPDPLALKVGQRIRQLREEQGLTMERLAFESELGSKGHLSNVERGLARPTIHTLEVLAERLGVEVFDLLTFPTSNHRHMLVDRTRLMKPGTIRKMLKETAPVEVSEADGPARPPPPKKAAKRRRASGRTRSR